MRLALLSVVAVGVVIGLTAPTKRAAAPVAPVAAEPVDAPRETVIEPDRNGHYFAFVEVDGEMTKFLVDTGADMVALTIDDARRAKIPFDPNAFEPIARGASGDVMGQNVVIAEVVLDGKRVRDVHGAVVADLDISLLGQSFLRHMHSVHITGGEMRLK